MLLTLAFWGAEQYTILAIYFLLIRIKDCILFMTKKKVKKQRLLFFFLIWNNCDYRPEKIRKSSFWDVWLPSLIRSSVYRPMLHWGVTSTHTHTHTIQYLLIHTHTYRRTTCFPVLFTNSPEIKLCNRTISESCKERQTRVLRVWLLEHEFFQSRHKSYLWILFLSMALHWPRLLFLDSEGRSASRHALQNLIIIHPTKTLEHKYLMNPTSSEKPKLQKKITYQNVDWP